jgi:hypothetical protein
VDSAVVIREFEKLARRMGIEIRYTVGGPSGLCAIKGSRILFIDRNLGESSRVELFAREFRDLDLDGMFVVPVIRSLLGRDDTRFEG